MVRPLRRLVSYMAAAAADAQLDSVCAARVRRRVCLPLHLPSRGLVNSDVFTFHGLDDGREHIALGLGDYAANEPPLVRIHSECLTGDALGSARCDCGPQLAESLRRISAVGGFLLYLRQEGRGIGLYNKIDSYAIQDAGADTFAANRHLGFDDDARSYLVAAQMLRALAVDRIELLTNSPDKVSQLVRFGIQMSAVHRTGVYLTPENSGYLATKGELAGHDLGFGYSSSVFDGLAGSSEWRSRPAPC